MKRTIILPIALATLLCSCGNKAKDSGETVRTDTVYVDTAQTDTTEADGYYFGSGDPEKAKATYSKILRNIKAEALAMAGMRGFKGLDPVRGDGKRGMSERAKVLWKATERWDIYLSSAYGETYTSDPIGQSIRQLLDKYSPKNAALNWGDAPEDFNMDAAYLTLGNPAPSDIVDKIIDWMFKNPSYRMYDSKDYNLDLATPYTKNGIELSEEDFEKEDLYRTINDATESGKATKEDLFNLFRYLSGHPSEFFFTPTGNAVRGVYTPIKGTQRDTIKLYFSSGPEFLHTYGRSGKSNDKKLVERFKDNIKKSLGLEDISDEDWEEVLDLIDEAYETADNVQKK